MWMKIQIYIILSHLQNKLKTCLENKGEKTYSTRPPPKKKGNGEKEKQKKEEEIVQNKMIEINIKISIVIQV